jgi:hypothetical protein
MKHAVRSFALSALIVPAIAYGDRYEVTTDPYGSSFGGSTSIEMRNKTNPDPSSRYRGEIESDGSVRMRNSNGDTLRGTIDSDGYGKLRDQNGNVIRIRPR